MRLSKNLINTIKEAIKDSFGDKDVYLFGSRIDDLKRGGDIDLALDVNLTREEFRKNKVKFISYLLRKNIDLKIDLVNYNTNDELLYSQIRKNSILL